MALSVTMIPIIARVGRGGAAGRAEWAARGEPGAGRVTVADGVEGRAADGSSRAWPPRSILGLARGVGETACF